MKGEQLTLSTGTVISLGLRGSSVVAHARFASQGDNRGAIVTRPCSIDDLADKLGLDLANLQHSDVTSLETALGKLS